MNNENQANKYYMIGYKNLNDNEVETALQVFNKALDICPNNEDYITGKLLSENFIKLSECEKFKGDVYRELDKCKACIHKIQLEKLNSKNKDKILSVNDNKIDKNAFSDKELSEIELMQKLDPQNDIYNFILAISKYYKDGIKYFTQGNFKKALEEFNKALEEYPDNKEYRLMVNLAEYKLNDPHVFYKNGLNELKKDNFEEAQKWFEKALNLKEDDLFKEAIKVTKNKKINIMEASKNILLTISCFDEAMVNEIVKRREEGRIWYNIDSFTEEFNIQPHDLIDLQDKIEFPAKQKNTISRKIEF